MSASPDPVLTRVRDGLHWPAWEAWSDDLAIPELDVETHPIDSQTRRAAIERRLHLAHTIDQGGPYLQIFRERAFDRLEREADQDLGPLASFTFAIKDLLAIEGRRVEAGSAVRQDAAVETATAPIVTLLERAGAIATGMVTLHEFAFGVTGINPYAGTSINPKAPDRITGGSSSGSASAVADGSARISIGTDTGGSIRGPASFCGIVGYKPTFGLYPAAGVFPLSGTLDHVGLFATTVGDVITAHRALGYAAATPALPARIGVARADVQAADADVRARTEAAVDALANAGCEIVDVSWPDAEATFVTSTAIMFPEASSVHAASFAAHPDRYGTDIKARLELGASLTGIEVASAHEMRRELIRQVRATLATVDVIVGPTTPMVAPLSTEASDPALPPRIVANTRLGNVVGLPAVSLPLPGDGPPVGLQVFGGNDPRLLSAAASIEAVLATI